MGGIYLAMGILKAARNVHRACDEKQGLLVFMVNILPSQSWRIESLFVTEN